MITSQSGIQPAAPCRSLLYFKVFQTLKTAYSGLEVWKLPVLNPDALSWLSCFTFLLSLVPILHGVSLIVVVSGWFNIGPRDSRWKWTSWQTLAHLQCALSLKMNKWNQNSWVTLWGRHSWKSFFKEKHLGKWVVLCSQFRCQGTKTFLICYSNLRTFCVWEQESEKKIYKWCSCNFLTVYYLFLTVYKELWDDSKHRKLLKWTTSMAFKGK